MTRFQAARSIHQLDEERWDAVVGGQLAMTHRWQRVMEASRRGYRPHYLLAEDDQGPLAIVVANATEASGRRGWREWLMRYSLLVMRGPFSSMDCGLLVRPGTPLSAVLPQLECGLRQLCWQARRPFLGVSRVKTDDLPAWRARRFLVSAQSPDTVLDLPADYDRYLETLSKKGRSELRRIHRRAETRDLRLSHGPLVGESELLYALLCEVFACHGTSPGEMEFTAGFFTALEREMADEVVVFKGFVDGTLAGYLLCLRSQETLWWLIAGLRYELARPSYLYFLLIDQMIRWGIAHGIRRVYGGTTNERQKQRHGFRLQEHWFCFRANSRLLNGALKGALPLVQRLLGASLIARNRAKSGE